MDPAHTCRPALAAALLLAGVTACAPALRLTPSDADRVLAHQALDAPDPGARGPYAVRTLYYGSGTDKHRAEYRDSVTVVTPTVDASKLVDLGESAGERNGYWGFTPEEMPLNARVWYPDGEGPFPLVLVVHGNHDMKDFSDPGYDYLGELLASRGYILASVDENFINGGIRQENDARGWFLLKHLALFRDWAGEEGNPFHGMVDMGNIALIGHSRGGEAVANAVAFNRLTHYPDDATLDFDFGFDIRGVVSIAPVDGQYLPTGRKVVMENVSYLTFHGSHDGDVTSFHGLRLYDRLRFTDEDFHFKSAIYVYRANHGQWNTVWGAHDNGPRSGRILDLRTLIPAQDQRRFAELYVSAFLEVTLQDDKRYLPMFRDHRVIGGWLPKTMYVTRFETSGFRPLATFEEDIDVTSGTESGVGLAAEGLGTWSEGTLRLRSSNRNNTSASQENQAVWLGWGEEDTDENGDGGAQGVPSFVVTLPAGLARAWALAEATTLDLLLAVNESDSTEVDPGQPPVDVRVEVTDRSGRSAQVTLGDYGAIRRPLETWISRRRDRERQRFATHWELVPQTFSIPLGDFTASKPGLDLGELAEIRLLFVAPSSGEVVVDQIGFSDLDPAFLMARVEGGSP